MNETDKKTLALNKVLSEMNLPREQLEITLITFMLMKFGGDERQVIQVLGNLQERWKSDD